MDSSHLLFYWGGCYLHCDTVPRGWGTRRVYREPRDTRAAQSVTLTVWLYVWTVGALWCFENRALKAPSVCKGLSEASVCLSV